MKYIILFLLYLPASGVLFSQENVSTAENEADEFDPKIMEALETPPDKFHIPEGLYQYDGKLDLFRNTIVKQNKTFLGFLIGGSALIGTGILFVQIFPDLVWAPYNLKTSIPWGYAISVLGVGVALFSLIGILPKIGKLKGDLRTYYTDKYGHYETDTGR